MAIGDILVLEQTSEMGRGSRLYNVAASATLIYPGEPVMVTALGDVVVLKADNNFPVVATDFVVGIAQTTSTNTASLAGTVEVLPMNSATTYLIAPKVALTFTQATYDAIVGKRYLIDLTAGAFTMLAADGATYGCVIQPLDFLKYNGKVAFAFRAGSNYLA